MAPSGSMLPDDALAEVTALVRDGRTIEAIRRYRELTGEGLKESKEAVEEIAAGRTPSFSPGVLHRLNGTPLGESLASGQQAELERLIIEGKKLEAIKLHRQLARTGLKEAKDAVDALEAKLLQAGSLPFPRDAGARGTGRSRSTWRWALVLLGVAVLIVVLSQRV